MRRAPFTFQPAAHDFRLSRRRHAKLGCIGIVHDYLSRRVDLQEECCIARAYADVGWLSSIFARSGSLAGGVEDGVSQTRIGS